MELNEQEKKDLRQILESFYGRQTVAPWRMNEKVLEATAKLMTAAKQCSTAMDYVPRSGVIDKNYLRRQLRDIARRFVERGTKGKNYEICHSVAASKWKTKIALAGQGF